MSTLLEAWNVGVLDVPGGGEAMALLDDLGIAPDVILADFHLDGATSGLDAIIAIRARFGPIPAFLITADRSVSLAAQCRDSGIPVLNKPLEPARLRALLAGIEPADAHDTSPEPPDPPQAEHSTASLVVSRLVV